MSAAVNVAATETVDNRYVGIDTWQDTEVLAALLDGQRRAIEAVDAAIPSLARAAELAVGRVRSGGRLIYLAAGSPALISLSDALELPGTYGILRERLVLVFAGGPAITQNLTGVDEDSEDQALADVAKIGVGPADCIIATSASGTTPYTVAGLKAARAQGAGTIGIAGNVGAPLLAAAEVPVLLATGGEVISGSTRMGAGTAQKAALNMLSTLMCMRLGHVHDGLMVNVKADNDKLRRRAERIVGRITGVDLAVAGEALRKTDGEVKPAILIAAGASDLAAAERLLQGSEGNVRLALASLSAESDTPR